jgi:hypothetical protein
MKTSRSIPPATLFAVLSGMVSQASAKRKGRMKMRQGPGWCARRLRAYAAASLWMVGVLIVPITARAQDVIAANTACATATAAAISAKWATEQAWAARDALRVIEATIGPDFAAARANADAAEATLTVFSGALTAAQTAANDACSKAYKAISDSGLEKHGAVGMVYCSPITIVDGALDPGEDWVGGARRLGVWANNSFPFYDLHPGVNEGERPQTIIVRNCIDDKSVTAVSVTPPPPDTVGTCPDGSIWSGSSLVGCRPCLPIMAGWRGCPLTPPKQISSTKPPSPAPGPGPGPNVCNPPNTVAIPVPQTPSGGMASGTPNVCHPKPKNACNPVPQTSSGGMASGTPNVCHPKPKNVCNPVPPPPSSPINLKSKPDGTQMANAGSSSSMNSGATNDSVPACESKPPFLPWGGHGSAMITVSGGKPCGIGWHDTGPTILDSMSVTSTPSHGSLKQQDQHVIIFTPVSGYKGQDSFTLSMQEHNGGRRATMSVKVSVTIQ